MTTPSDPEQQLATPDQVEELRSLAAAAGEEIPSGITETEAQQRIVELRSSS